jgi:hypothetical protein
METPQAPIPETLRKGFLIVAIITASILGIIAIIIGYFSIQDTRNRNIEDKMFQTYEVLSQKIIPSNFALIQTREFRGSIDATAHVQQTFKVSSIRKEVIEQLEPIFKSHGFRTSSREDYRWYLYNSTTSVRIDFFPEYPSNNPEPDLSSTKVEEITIWWSCNASAQSCLKD